MKNTSLPSHSPSGSTWTAAVGSKGVVLAVAKKTADGKLIPAFDHNGVASRDLPAVQSGVDITAPWSGRVGVAPSNAALGAYVGTRSEKVTILPLEQALSKGLVKPHKVFVAGKQLTVFFPKGWKDGESVPQYVGTTDNGPLGRFEPYAHPDPKRRQSPAYDKLHSRVSFTPPGEEKPAKETKAPAKGATARVKAAVAAVKSIPSAKGKAKPAVKILGRKKA